MKKFTTDALMKGHNIVIGDRKVKDGIVQDLVFYYAQCDGDLVVFDYDGRLYESYNGMAALADFSSMESFLPNIMETLMRSQKYGAELKSFVTAIQKLHMTTKQDRNSNDVFWSQMGGAAFQTYIEYLCALYKFEKFAASQPGAGMADNRRDLALFAKYSGHLLHIMAELTISPRDKDDKSGLERDAVYSFLEHYEQSKNGAGANPFDGSVRNPGAQYSGAFQSIFMSMRAFASPFFAFMELLENNGEALASLPYLNISEFLSSSGDRVPLFVCGTASQQANQGFGALTLLAFAAAANEAGSHVTVVIPELERWNLYDALSYVKGEWPGNLFSSVVSFSDIRKLADLLGTDKRSALTSLSDSADRQLWLHSTDAVCEDLFKDGNPANIRSYSLNELGEQFAAYGV